MGYEVFEKLCKERGVTPYRVAKDTGVTTATLSSWKNGRYTPKLEKLQKLADYFGVSVDTLNDNTELVQTHAPQEYYYDPDTMILADTLHKNKELRILFDAAKDISSEDLYLVYGLLQRMKKTNKDE